MTAALIVGEISDPHVECVLRAIEGVESSAVVLDAAALTLTPYCLSDGGLTLDLAQGSIEVTRGSRGWIRRVAPAGWNHGVLPGSRAAAQQGAAIALLAAILHGCNIEWLSEIGPLLRAENKVVQYETAIALGLPVPPYLVTSKVATAVARLGKQFVAKPLGPAEFVQGDEAMAVFATVVDSNELTDATLLEAPFLFQRTVQAERHLRVVTVGGQAWVGALDATPDTPLDWRRLASAHRSFVSSEHGEVAAGAVRLAEALSLRYSSQDWVLEDGEPWFLDLNPGGQWLFLPPEVRDPVTSAIAAWLTRTGRDL